jgi:hypothetical protein
MNYINIKKLNRKIKRAQKMRSLKSKIKPFVVGVLVGLLSNYTIVQSSMIQAQSSMIQACKTLQSTQDSIIKDFLSHDYGDEYIHRFYVLVQNVSDFEFENDFLIDDVCYGAYECAEIVYLERDIRDLCR